MAPSPRIASVTRKPSRPGTPMAAVGWNCSNSRSASRAPAACASSRPTPWEPGGLVVRAHSAAAPPVASTTARADTSARRPLPGCAVTRPVAPVLAQQPAAVSARPRRCVRVRPQRARAGALQHRYPLLGGGQRRQLPDDAPPGRAASRVDDAPDRMSALQPQREPAEAIGVETHAQRLQVLDARGRLAHEDLRRRAPDQPAPRALGVGEVELGRVIGGERRGETALRPVARGLRQRCGRDQDYASAVAGGAQRRVQPGRARAHNREIGLRARRLGCLRHGAIGS